MAVLNCHLCAALGSQPSEQDLANGDYCPVCHRPTCRSHLATVRFRWITTRAVDSALICRDCKTSYQHRYWDTARREWIS